MTADGTTTMAVVPSPPAEPPMIGLIAALGPPGGRYLDPPEDWQPWEWPPFSPEAPNPGGLDMLPGRAAPTPPDGRWPLGFQYLPEQTCSTASATDPCSPHMTPVGAQPDVVKANTFLVWAGDTCSAFGWQAHDFRGRALRALLASESKQIAAELWSGTQAQASGWPNAYLASPASDTLSAGPVGAATALDCLEQALAECSNGQRGAIHCTRQLGSFWSGLGNTLRTVNGLIMTYAGTLIIPDAGYPGTGPNGEAVTDGSQWAYATLLPTVRRGPVDVTPGTFGEALNRSVNTLTWRASRLAAATFPPCCKAAIEVDMPLCLVGGAS